MFTEWKTSPRGTTALLAAIIGSVSPGARAGAATLDRTVLPIPEPRHAPITEVDVRRATPPRAST